MGERAAAYDHFKLAFKMGDDAIVIPSEKLLPTLPGKTIAELRHAGAAVGVHVEEHDRVAHREHRLERVEERLGVSATCGLKYYVDKGEKGRGGMNVLHV